MIMIRIAALTIAVVLAVTSTSSAQDGSLFGRTGQTRPMGRMASSNRMPARRPLTLAQYSWTYEAPPQVRKMQVNDLIMIIVEESSLVTSEAEVDRRKRARVAAALKDWVLFKGLSMIPDPQSAGEPKVTASMDNKMQSEGELEVRDRMTFHIKCRVAEIRPNGNLIIEGRRTITNNSEIWNQSLIGEVQPGDIQPDNTIKSEDVADLRIEKWEAGSVRDSYRRGWFLKWLDKYQPF